MDTQTRHAMKHDALVDRAQSAFVWLEENKSQAILVAVIVVVVLVIGIGSTLFYQHHETKASTAFGAAMDIYNTPVAQPGIPVEPGVRTYPTTVARAEAANAAFQNVVKDFGSTETGKNALYFSGLTLSEMGKTAEAETTLKKVAHEGNKNLASLANLALANLYRKSGNTQQAIQTLKQIADHPTLAVPAGEANLELASIYEETNPGRAKQIYAQLKDKDSRTTAGQIAAQKLQQMH